MKLRHKMAALAGAVLISVTAALAAGNFTGFPVVGGAAYCTGSSLAGVPGTATACNSPVPAGPTALTGLELIPADTQIAGGAAPQTVLIPTTMFNTGTVQVITTGAANTLANGISTVILNGVGATEAITFPPNPVNNQIVRIINVSGVAITTFSVVANSGQSIVGTGANNLVVWTNNAAAAALSQTAYIFQSSNSTWYRIQ